MQEYSDHFICMRDPYPKGLRHFLCIPRPAAGRLLPGMRGGVRSLSRAHLPELEELRAFALQVSASVARVEGAAGSGGWRGRLLAGFHAVPSLEPLHLHLISDEFAGVALKGLVHYQSFASAFFITLDAAIAGVQESSAALDVNSDAAALEALKAASVRQCHLCGKGAREGVEVPRFKTGEDWSGFKKHLRECDRQRLE